MTRRRALRLRNSTSKSPTTLQRATFLSLFLKHLSRIILFSPQSFMIIPLKIRRLLSASLLIPHSPSVLNISSTVRSSETLSPSLTTRSTSVRDLQDRLPQSVRRAETTRRSTRTSSPRSNTDFLPRADSASASTDLLCCSRTALRYAMYCCSRR